MLKHMTVLTHAAVFPGGGGVCLIKLHESFTSHKIAYYFGCHWMAGIVGHAVQVLEHVHT